MKKNRIFAAVAALVLCLTLVACGSPAPSTSGNPGSVSQLPVSSSPAEPGSLYSWGTLRGCEPADYLFAQGSGTAHGFYEISPLDWSFSDFDEAYPGCRIDYTDYAARQKMALCNQPQCTHTSDTCPAWLPHHREDYRIFEAGGRMVLAYRGQELYNENGGLSGIREGSVEVMDYSGAGRQTLVQFTDGYRIEPFATDDEYLYATRYAPLENPDAPFSSYDREVDIISIHLQSGQVTSRCKLDVAREESLCYLLGQELVVRWVDYPVDNRTLPEGDAGFKQWEENVLAAKTRFFALNLETWQRRELPVELPVMYLGERGIYDGSLYYIIADEAHLPETLITTYRVEMETGETEELSTFSSNPGEFYGVVDGHMMAARYNGEDESLSELLWIDMTSGEEHLLPHRTYRGTRDAYYPGQSSGTFMLPMVDAITHYLVCLELAGTPESHSGMVLALILKEDYWNGVENYLPITSLG